jgi:hypothetical protein
MGSKPRTADVRKADALAKLSAGGTDVWVASASLSGSAPHAHLVPLSLTWIDERVVIALKADSPTARNITQHGAARLALGPTRDVVMIDALLEQAINAEEAPSAFAERYARQAGWDPRTAGGGFIYLVLRPERIQAWREANEGPGRTLMRSGKWVS